MSEQERKMAEKANALTDRGDLKTGFSFRPNWVGKDDREVLQLIRTVVAETRYSNVFHSRGRQLVVGQVFV
jgi:hypothetical protein